MAESVDAKLLMTVLREIRSELKAQGGLLVQTAEFVRGLEQRLETRLLAIERRQVELKDDLELMIKAELMGRLAHFETRLDEKLASISQPPR